MTGFPRRLDEFECIDLMIMEIRDNTVPVRYLPYKTLIEDRQKIRELVA